MFVWGRDNKTICDCIRSSRATLKIILKTRNEVHLIEKWLAYYTGMLRAGERIIILDNMSTEEAVFAVYRKYVDSIILVSFDGNVDTAHSLSRFAELYAAVWNSSLYYALLDTDEFLALFDGQKMIHDEKVLLCLERHGDADFFPPLRLSNVFGRDDVFFFEERDIASYHLDGKPVLNSARMRRSLTMPVGHTRDVPLFLFETTPLPFVLFHLTNLSREQRIRANMQKLVNFGIITDESDYSAACGAVIPEELLPHLPHLPAYVDELRWLLSITDPGSVTREMLGRDTIAVDKDGKTTFSSPEQKALFKKHVNTKTAFLEAVGLDIPPDANREERLSRFLTK